MHGPDLAHELRVSARGDAGGGLVRLTLTPDEACRRSYLRPGQYVAVRPTIDGARPGFFVLAGDVGASAWELLVRPRSDAASAVVAVPDGGTLASSAALGEGFPMDEARGRSLLLAATGSGIAAMRPVASRRIREGEASRTELLLGVRTTGDVPLASELGRWRLEGLRVTVCLSQQDPPSQPGFARGYVQDVARTIAGDAAHRGGMIFAAGVKPMIEAVRELSKHLGVDEADVRTNY